MEFGCTFTSAARAAVIGFLSPVRPSVSVAVFRSGTLHLRSSVEHPAIEARACEHPAIEAKLEGVKENRPSASRGRLGSCAQGVRCDAHGVNPG